MTKANQFVTSSFKNVGDTALDLTQIKVVGYTGANNDKVSVQFIDSAGNTAKDGSDKAKWYYWQDADGYSSSPNVDGVENKNGLQGVAILEHK